MWLYTRLAWVLPSSVAIVLTAFWFAVLLIAVLFCAVEPQVQFIYGNL